MSSEIDYYQLMIELRGDHFSDRCTFEADDPADFEPLMVVRAGLAFERYGSDDDWREVRADYVVMRRMRTIYKEPGERVVVPGRRPADDGRPDGEPRPRPLPEGAPHGA